MRKKNLILTIELIAIAISLIALFFINIKAVISILLFILLILNYLIYKEKIGQELIIAVLFAIIITSYYLYEYTAANILIGKINIFPLTAWTAGLVLLREIYERLKTKHKLPIAYLIYLVSLLLVEYIGYYIFKIKLNSDFPSLLGLGIIHTTLGMKLIYIITGPIYLIITDYLKVK